MKIISWNIASIRKFKNYDYLKNDYDVIAIQEIRYNNIYDIQQKYKLDNYYDMYSFALLIIFLAEKNNCKYPTSLVNQIFKPFNIQY